MTRTGLLVVIASLLAGAAVGFGLGRGFAPERPSVDRTPASRGESRRPPPTAEGVESTPTTAGGRTLAEAIASLPPPRAESGEGVITGRVTVQDAGGALSGVLVRAVKARVWSGAGDGAPPRQRALADQVEIWVRNERARRLNRWEATTGSDGTFRLEGLPAGRFRLQAWRQGYSIWSRGAHEVALGSDVRFEARLLTYLEATVLMPDGTEPDRATIELTTNEHGQSSLGWSPGSRRLSFGPGHYQARAKAGPDGELISDPVPVEIVTGEIVAVTLQLRSRPGVKGTVRFADGIAEPGIEVRLRHLGDTEEPDPDRLAETEYREWMHEGSGFAFAGLNAGRYHLGVLLGSRVLCAEVVTVVDRMIEQDLVVPAPAPGEAIVVKVLGPDWKPLAGARFTVQYETENGSSSSGVAGSRQPDGSYRIRLRDSGNYGPGGTWSLKVRSTAHGEQSVDLAPEKEPTVVVQFHEPARLTVTVEGVEGSGYEGEIDIGVFSAGVRRSGMSQRYEGGSERSYGPYTPGDYSIELRVRAGRHESVTVAHRQVRLQAGENAVALRLPRLYELAILAEKEAGEVHFGVRSKDRKWNGDFRGKDGRVIVRGLPAGTYLIRRWGGRGMGQMEVTVPGQKTVKFEAKTVNALRVEIKDENGPVARAGIRTGDLVIGVNGELFENEADVQVKLMAAMAKEGAKLILQRGGTRLEVTLDLRPFLTREVDPGADLEPDSRD